MTVGLIRSETARDLRTLTATGASSTTRRTITGATAAALALLGALLGTAGAYLALLAWYHRDLHPMRQVPVLNLVTIVIGLPLLAAICGWLLAGREPPVNCAPTARIAGHLAADGDLSRAAATRGLDLAMPHLSDRHGWGRHADAASRDNDSSNRSAIQPLLRERAQ